MTIINESELRTLKKLLNMTTAEFARALNVSTASAGNYLAGRQQPRAAVQERIAKLQQRLRMQPIPPSQLGLDPLEGADPNESVPEYAKPEVMKAVRITLGFSQGMFAERNGFNQGTYCQWELGKIRVPRHHYPTLEKAYRAAEKLGFNEVLLKASPSTERAVTNGHKRAPAPATAPVPAPAAESVGIARASDMQMAVSAEALLELNTEFIEKFKEARQRQIIDSAIAYASQKAQEAQDFSPIFLRKMLGLILLTGIQEDISSTTLYRYVTGLTPP